MGKIRSRTKQSVEKTDIIIIIEHHFNKNIQIGEIEELDEGYSSIAYAIEIQNLDYNIVIKFTPPSLDYQLIDEQKGIETEVEFISFLEKTSSRDKIHFPKLLFADVEGKVIGRPYFIMRKFEGPTWQRIRKELSEEQNNSLCRQLGTIQRNINEIKGDYFGSFVLHDKFPVKKQTWGEAGLEMFRNMLRDSKQFKTGLILKKKKILKTIECHFPALNDIKEPKLVHWDLWEGNTFIVKKDKEWIIEGIIDFERALWGDPLMEMLFREVWRYEPFIQSYGEEILNHKSAEIREAIYSLYLLMIMIIESSARNYQLSLKINYKFIGWRYFRKQMRYLSRNCKKTIQECY